MELILPGKYVEIAYKLYEVAPNGAETLVHTVEPSDPERFIFGITPGLIPALERGLEGKAAGQKFNIGVPSAEGFPYNPDDVATLPIDLFEVEDGKVDVRLQKGARLPMVTSQGYMINGKVLEINKSERTVTMDFNHPLVGKDLRFDGKVVTVREATPEELHPSCGGGCGGCGGGCGDGSEGCGCGDGCGGCN